MLRDEVKERLLKVRARDRKSMHEPRANRRRQRDAQPSRRHRARHGPVHLAAAADMIPIRIERITRRARIEVQ